MANKIMKTLTMGENIYEIYDESARTDIATLQTETSQIQETIDNLKDNVGQPTDEQIQTAVDNYLDENPVTGGTSAVNTDYKWVKSGQMRTPVRDFQGWAHCVQYDKELGKAVGIVISGSGSHSNSAPLYRVTIDNNGYMSEYEEMIFNYPSSDSKPTGYIGTFLILEDGTYWLCDYRQRIFTSSDKGYTWDFVTQLTLGGRSAYNNDSLFGVTVLSNGRFIGGNIGNVASETYYSDNGVDWTTVAMDKSQLGSQTYPETGYVPFEPFFIDCGNGKVIQYARASMNAFKSYGDGAWSKQEGAVYSVSTDNGATWTPWKWSESIVDMTANNGKVVVIDGVVHCVYGSRYLGYTDEYGNTPFFALRYAHTTLERVLSDTWEESVVIDVGHWDEATASMKTDCGYPSIWHDENSNLFAVYYDSDESGVAYGANWRLLIANPYVQNKAVEDSGNGSKNVAYSQAKVDELLMAQKRELMLQIADLYEAIGQLPPVSDLDGSMYVTDSLVASWDFWDIEKWEDKFLKSTANDYYAYASVAPTLSEDGNWLSSNTVDIGFSTNKTIPSFSAMLKDFGMTGDFTIEDVQYYDSHPEYHLDAQQINGTWIQPQIKYSNVPVPSDDGKSVTVTDVGTAPSINGARIGHLVLSGNTISTYKNGILIGTLELTDTQKNWMQYIGFRHRGMNQGYRCLTRYYSKALSQEEINNNVTYDLSVCKAI